MIAISEKHAAKGKLIVLSAPSGTGKSTIASAMLEETPNLRFSTSATTRNIREGEVDGREYHFLSEVDFKEKIEANSFIEYENFFGNNTSLLIFIKPPSLEILKERLLKRATDSEQQIAHRLKRAEYEMSFADQYDEIVINDDITIAISTIKSLIYQFLNLNA